MTAKPYLVTLYVDDRKLGLGYHMLVVTSVGPTWAHLADPIGLRTTKLPATELRAARVESQPGPKRIARCIKRRARLYRSQDVTYPKDFRRLSKQLATMDAWA